MIPVKRNARIRINRATSTPAQAVQYCYAPENGFLDGGYESVDPDVGPGGWAHGMGRHMDRGCWSPPVDQFLLLGDGSKPGLHGDTDPCLLNPVLKDEIESVGEARS